MAEQIQKKTFPQPQRGFFETASSFVLRYEFLIPLALFVIFLAVALPGISWGAPSLWHPDEIVYIAIKALYSNFDFDTNNYNHPHLPIYLMLWLGKVVLALGGDNKEMLIAARTLSAVLIGFTIVLSYYIPRRMGYNPYIAATSGLLVLVNSEMIHNGHFAHNDTFVTFFTTLTFFLLVLYKTRGHRGWLYATFYSAGLAISSKYSAISLAVIPFLVYAWAARRSVLKQPLRVFETLFIGSALTYLGYATGTPKALTWMAFYMKRLIPALLYNSSYWVLPDSERAIQGQYGVVLDGVGFPLFLIFALSLLWAVYKIYNGWRSGTLKDEGNRILLLLAIAVIDLPIAVSYNYPIRFFLPLMPLLSVLGALFIHDMYARVREQQRPVYSQLLGAGLSLAILFSFGRVLSVMVLFLNDSRIPASTYIATLPAGTSIEPTFYAPTFPEDHFERSHNYPLFFPKAPGQTPPTDKSYEFNKAETGLDDRNTDYLLIDSFTADKFKNQYTCASVQNECDFFKQLETGHSDHYKLLAEFSYSPPAYLPQINVDFVNPTIRIYERIQ